MNMMQKSSLAAALVAACAVVQADSEVYDHYFSWQQAPVRVDDPQAGNNVRHQVDFTVPLHGPWLTLPAETSMTVTWITRVPCAGGIQYREKGTEEWTTRWTVKYGQVDYSREIQSYHLTGLKPATEYEYRLLSNCDNYSTAYHMVKSVGREIYSFKTVDPKRDHYKMFVTSDFHGGSRLILDPMIDNCGANDADFYLFNGDNVEDHVGHNIRHNITFGYLDDVVRKWGTSKPTLFVRGNHDVWGIDTYKYGDYFPQPDGKTYYAFRQGPALFILIDTLWKAKEQLQEEQHLAYLDEQADWVRAMKKTEMWKGAKFRIAFMHVAPFPGEGNTWVGEHLFKGLFDDESKDGRIHMLVGGHVHEYWRLNPNTRETRVSATASGYDPKKYPAKWAFRDPVPERFPYVAVSCECTEGMTIEVSPEKLTVKSHRWSVKDGGLRDAFELTPDCQVKDLIETTAYSFVPPAKKN